MSGLLSAYTAASDGCKEISDFSPIESIAAADKACDQAFRTLNGLGLNICFTWRQAACRFIPGDQHRRCTCILPHQDDYFLSSDFVMAFIDCVPAFVAHQFVAAHTAATHFQQSGEEYNNALDATRLQRSYRGSDRAGSSNSAYRSAEVGSSSGKNTAGIGNPSATSISNAPGASSSAVPKPTVRKKGELPKPFECNECGGKFRSARVLYDHKRTHHFVGDTHCYSCNFTYKNKKGFVSHLRQTHPDFAAALEAALNLPADAEALAILPYSCNMCPKRFSSYKALAAHKKIHSTNDAKCPECGKSYGARRSLRFHMGKEHPGVPLPETASAASKKKKDLEMRTESGKFLCSHCGRTYDRLKSLRDHARSHNTLDTYCPYCEKTLSTRYNYRIHTERRHPEFAVAESVTARQRYEAERPIKCGQCSHRFKNDRGLQEHMPVHEGKTTCDECNEILPRVTALAAHKKEKHQ